MYMCIHIYIYICIVSEPGWPAGVRPLVHVWCPVNPELPDFGSNAFIWQPLCLISFFIWPSLYIISLDGNPFCIISLHGNPCV